MGILDIAKCLYDAITRIQHTYDVSDDRLSEVVQKVIRIRMALHSLELIHYS